MQNNIEQLDILASKIQETVTETSSFVITDFHNKEQIETLKSYRTKLRDMRLAITKKGKELREDALKFQKAVIAKEKSYVDLIEPEETRLDTLYEHIKQMEEKEKIKALYPIRKELVEKAGVVIDDELLLELSTPEFETLLNQKVSDKNEATRKELEKKELELKAEQDRIDREKRDAEIKEKAEKAEKEALEKKEKFMGFLTSLGWTEETKQHFLLNHVQDKKIIRVYKLLGEYNDN